MAERYQQFFLIALGESILVTGFAFSGGRYAPAPTAVFVVAFVTTILLWRKVFARVSWSRLVAIVALAAVLPGMPHLPPLAVAATVTIVLAGITLYDGLRVRGQEPESPASPL